jgi:flagellar hook-length control protein FliK
MPSRAEPQKIAEAKDGSKAPKQTSVASAPSPPAPVLPPLAVAPDPTGNDARQNEAAGKDGTQAAVQDPGSGSAVEPAPAPAAGSAISQQAEAAPVVATPSAGSVGTVANTLPAAGMPTSDGVSATSAGEGLADRAPAAQASAPAPASQALPDATPPFTGAAALAEARDTVALRVAHAAQDGVQTISIDLHPAELGHVGIELSFHEGGVSVQMTLARHETYEAFARDRGALEQQLAQSGLSLGSGGLDLRFGQRQDQQPAFAGTQVSARVAPPQPAAATNPAAAPRASDGRLNIIA